MADPERIPLGKVMITPRGNFVLGTQYYKLDLVTDGGGNTYLAIADNKNVPLTDTSKWDKIVDVDAAKNDVNDLTDAVFADQTLDVWVQGGIYSDGTMANIQTAIRNSTAQSFENVVKISCADGYFFVLYAWNGSTYVGMWTGSEFSTTTSIRNTDLSMQPIVAAHPGYTYRISLRHTNTSTTITPVDGANCVFTTAKISSYVSSIDGADMTTVITDALTKYGNVELGPGTFLINNIEMPDYTTLKGKGRATKLVVGNYHTHGITAGKGCTIENLEIDGKASAIPDTKGDSAGIAIISDGETDYYNIKISGVTIYGFNLAGIYAYRTGYWCADSVSAMNCEMRYCYAGIFCDTNAEYGRYTNILAYGCNFGALVNGGNNKFANCDFTNNRVGFYLNAQADGTVNNGHGSCVGCTFNHSGNSSSQTPSTGRAIIANSVTNGYIFSGCQIHYGIVYVENSAGILFDGCNFGADVTVTDYTNTSLLFIGCTFRAEPTKIGDKKASYIDCYLIGSDTNLSPDELKYDTFFAKGESKSGLAVCYRTGVISVNGTKSDTQALFFTVQPEGAKYASRMIIPTGNTGGAPNIPLKQGHKYALRGTFTRPTQSLIYGLYLAYKNAATDETWQKIEIRSSTSSAPTETPTITFDHMGKLFLGVTATTDTAVNDTINFVLEDITEV